jgi:hypothetical protein
MEDCSEAEWPLNIPLKISSFEPSFEIQRDTPPENPEQY